MSRRQRSREVEITVDKRFLFAFAGFLVLVLTLGLGILVGQLTSGPASPVAQSAPLPAAQIPQAGPVAQVQPGDGEVQVVPQAVQPGQGDVLTEADAAGLVAGDVMQSPCYVPNLLEFRKNVVAADFRLTKEVPIEGPHPRLVVEGLNSHCDNAFNFGILEPTEVGQQTLTLKNEGDAPLTITGIYTSCGCTVAQLEGHEIDANGVLSPPLVLQPGESREFVVAVDAKRVQGSNEPRIVQIFSDDPRGVPFGDQWPFPGQDRELRFGILAQVGLGSSDGQSSTP